MIATVTHCSWIQTWYLCSRLTTEKRRLYLATVAALETYDRSLVRLLAMVWRYEAPAPATFIGLLARYNVYSGHPVLGFGHWHASQALAERTLLKELQRWGLLSAEAT
jgi:hypothetical protein